MIKKILNSSIFWIIIIGISASLFRIFFLELGEFKTDEAATFSQLITFYENPSIIQKGIISSLGIYNFPLFTYLIIGLGVFAKSPYALMFSIALINTILISLFYFLSKKFFDTKTTIFSSLILAFSPWAILFSRKIWAQDLIFLFLIPLFYFLNGFFAHKKSYEVHIFFLLVLLSELHFSGIFLFVSIVLTILILRIKINIQKVLFGIILGLIPALPYLFFQISSSPICPDCIKFFSYQGGSLKFDPSNFIKPFQTISMLGFGNILGPDSDYQNFVKIFPYIYHVRLFFIITLPIFFLGFFEIFKNRKEFLYLPLLILITPFLFFLTRSKGYIHYYVILIPFIVIVFAFGFTSTFNFFKNIYFKGIVILIFLIFIAGNFIFEVNFYQYLSSQKRIAGDYGVIFSETEKLVVFLTQDYKKRNDYQKIKSIAYINLVPPPIYQGLGEYFIKTKEYELAEKELQKAIASYDSRYTKPREMLINLYQKMGKIYEANEQIKLLESINNGVSYLPSASSSIS